MKEAESILTPALTVLLKEKHQQLASELQRCKQTLEMVRAGQGSGGSAEQIGRWEATKENERKEIALESKLELIEELLSEGVTDLSDVATAL